MKRYIPKIQPGRKSVHERLGGRQSGCESIHLNRIYSLETNFKAKKSIQNRLSKNFFNPSAAERNRITLQTLNTLTSCAKKTTDTTDEMNGNFLFQALSNAIKTVPKKKYDMRIQKEITCLQVIDLRFYMDLIHSNPIQIISILIKIYRGESCFIHVQAQTLLVLTVRELKMPWKFHRIKRQSR